MRNQTKKLLTSKLVLVVIVLIAIAVYAVCCHKPQIIGGEKDSHGCIIPAGYSWCEAKQKCLRMWEEPCDSLITYNEAHNIAENSSCTEKGELSDNRVYNGNTRTWWIDLEMKPEFQKQGCNPACVVNEETKTAEINWRCTGLLPS